MSSQKYPIRCGKKEKRLPAMRKGLMNAAPDLFLIKHGEGQLPITKRYGADIRYFPRYHRRAV